MVWIFAGVVLVLFVAVPGFRWAIAGLVVVAVVVGSIMAVNVNQERDARVAKAKSLIQPSQLKLINERLKRENSYLYYTGRIENNSAHTLTSLDVTLRFYDCPVEQGPLRDCKIYHEEKKDFYIEVPPNQVRDFSQSIREPTTKPYGYSEWSSNINEILAK